jgi:hypothetical protein
VRLLFLLALAACGSKDVKAPAVDTIDRSCTADADCMLAVDVCCTGCGGDVGEPVNRLAWAKAPRRDCTEEKCPDFNCQKPPDCQDEHAAICRAGTCERETKPSAACADLACETAADCTLDTFRDCCDQCGGPPISKLAAERKRNADAAGCAAKTVQCPSLDCKMIVPDCVDKKCVTK